MSDAIKIDDVMTDIMDGAYDNNPDDLDTDDDGQLIIYTDIYRWADGSYHKKKEKVK